MSNKFDSDDEEIFYNWCVEAKNHGIIHSFVFHPEPIEIYPEAIARVQKQLKTKVKIEEKTILRPVTYQADFLIIGDISIFNKGFTYARDKIFTIDMQEPVQPEEMIYQYGQKHAVTLPKFLIDTKPSGFTKFNDDKSFSIIRKALWHSKGIYVNKLRLDKFFSSAWLPMPVLDKGDKVWTNPGSSPRRKRSTYKFFNTYNESEWSK